MSCSPGALSYSWSANTGFGSSTTTGTVSPTVTTTYSVRGSNGGGAGNTASVTVFVTTSVTPVCTLTAAPASIAPGGTATLTANCDPAATSYIWTGGTCPPTTASGCTVTPSATTTYTVAGINSSGTGTAAVAAVTVTAPVFPMTVAASIGPRMTTVTATIQFRPQDIGTTGSVYVFALAPATAVTLASNAEDEFQPPGYPKSADGSKDTSVACVLAQLNACRPAQAGDGIHDAGVHHRRALGVSRRPSR